MGCCLANFSREMAHQMASNNGVGRVKRRRMGIGHRMFSRIPEMAAASPQFFIFFFPFTASFTKPVAIWNWKEWRVVE